jgi:subtilisin family serine protease/subtilisin-like proprotein convertase family protein
MFEVKFGRKDEPSTTLRRSEDLVAVRTRSTRPLMNRPVKSPSAGLVQDGQLVLDFPEAGVEVYRVPVGPGARSLNARKEALRRDPDVRFAGGVLVDDKTGEPVVYTENLFVKFVDEADPDECRQVIRQAGLNIKKELAYATNAFFVSAPDDIGTEVFALALGLLQRQDVEYCHPEVVRRRARKQIFPQQWHLKTTTVGGVRVAASANIDAAHALSVGQGTTIAVIDDGVDVDHVEFSSPGKIVAPRDATRGTDNPRPGSRDHHGTACAGVACADGRFGASGVAPLAKLMPIRLDSGLGSMHEADAFQWAADHGADVISCSWGPEDGAWWDPGDPLHDRAVPLPASTRLAIDYATTQGRGGNGCVVLFAAGNGNESVDNDGYASYERVIAVGACNDRGKRSVYSDYGRAVWCAFPSNDIADPDSGRPAPLTPGIWTTDRSGPAGYNPGSIQSGDAQGHYANDFGGTSSACPGAAGVAALVLAANPSLHWREVKGILKSACDRIDPEGGKYQNGHSQLYGHGRLNGVHALELSRPAPTPSMVISGNFHEPLPDLQTVTVGLEVREAQPLASLSVHLELLHSYIGDLVITLVPPDGTGLGRVVLHNRKGGATRNLKHIYTPANTPALQQAKGKSAAGTWALEVRDAAVRDEGTLVRFGLECVFGSSLRIGPSPRPQPAAGQGKRASQSKSTREAPGLRP